MSHHDIKNLKVRQKINTPLCIVFSTLFSVFDTVHVCDETLCLVFDILRKVLKIHKAIWKENVAIYQMSLTCT